MPRLRWIVSLLFLTVVCSGCTATRPRNFRAMQHPAPIVRARAAGLNASQPDAVAIPSLIDHLSDKDPVVRLSSHEALKERTKQDFGFIPWAEERERATALTRWRSWWESRKGSAYRLPQAALGKRGRKP